MIFLRIRIPEWATGVQSLSNYTLSDGFVVIRKKWKEEVIEIRFETSPMILTDSKGDVYFRYGALLYALPLQEREFRGKAYPGNCFDRLYEPVDSISAAESAPWSYSGGQPEVVANGLSIRLRRKGSRVDEDKLSVPLGRTILRQLTFPRL